MKKVSIISPSCPAFSLPAEYAVGAGEELSLVIVVLPGVSVDIPLDITIEGEGASVNVDALYLCSGSEKVSLKVNMNHVSGGSVSNQLIRGVVGGNARTDFFGLIKVAPDAQKTEAYQSNYNLLLSEEAKVETRPQLEIYADDVKCSHGAAVGKLDEEEQFYMRSRGITLKEARALQMISFVSPVVEKIEDEATRTLVYNSLRTI
ncbi:MAG: SufD family Fe-S cluster assembly protein [Bacteroidales bacterium]|nr:SufD family Fe-S cluster assembly protein [Bacteroidales bacterium]